MQPTAERATFRDVFAISEFRALWASQILSVVGDRLALVALTILVFQRTGSPLLTASAYAAGYVPWVVGGLAVSGMADRFPRREVMVACDMVRAVLVGIMAIPGAPLWLLVLLLFSATSFAPPFESARAATFPDVLKGERYVLGVAIAQATFRMGVVIGFAIGGIAVGFLGPRPSLMADAATFALSALLIHCWVRSRPAARPESGHIHAPLARIGAGLRLVLADRTVRVLVLFGWLVAFYAVPEGVAAPYAKRLGGGSATIGLILAAGAFGGMIAAICFTRLVKPRQRQQWLGPLAIAAPATLMLCLTDPGSGASLAIFALSGAFSVYQIAANAEFVGAVPNRYRAQGFGIANAGLIVGQGIVFVLAGAAAQVMNPSMVIAISGGLGASAAAVLAVKWRSRANRVDLSAR